MFDERLTHNFFVDLEGLLGERFPTRLERIATACLQGMLARQERFRDEPSRERQLMVRKAAEYARALIAELNKGATDA